MDHDTVKLLRECDAGVKMGITSVDEVLDCIKNDKLREALMGYKHRHEVLGQEIIDQLKAHDDPGKEPAAMAKGMSWIKTNVKLAFNESDATVADLMTDGCNMGVKSLRRYLNQYKAAEEPAKEMAQKLISLEEDMVKAMQPYL